MAIVMVDGLHPDYLRLATQANANVADITRMAHYRAQVWAPAGARSYSITAFRHTDYHGRASDRLTGYTSFNVTYYSRVTEGQYRVIRGYTWSGVDVATFANSGAPLTICE